MAERRGSFRVGLLGAGYIAEFHLRALRALNGPRPVAVCDLAGSRAEAFAAAAGDLRPFDSLEEMLAAERLDAVHVLTPPPAHERPLRRLLEAGIHVLVEKPLATDPETARELSALAAEHGCRLGTSHNFLFSRPYERLRMDVAGGRLGRLEEVEIIWSKPLPQLHSGPFGAWMLKDPRNIMLEVAPHSFAALVDLLGEPAEVTVHTGNPIELASGVRFQRRWEVCADMGRTRVRMHFSFDEGVPEHRIRVRGSTATGLAELTRDVYTRSHHRPLSLDFDRFAAILGESSRAVGQGASTLLAYAASKAGFRGAAEPFAASIFRSVGAFYAGLDRGVLDPRLADELACRVVSLGSRCAASASLPEPDPHRQPPAPAPIEPSVLVLGGTGFIGVELVRQLRARGRGVRVLARDPAGVSRALLETGCEIVKGDLKDEASLRRALSGIEQVHHLARGYADDWAGFLAEDVEPTERLAELCLEVGVKRLVYVSSIALFDTGPGPEPIRDDTPPSPAMVESNVYARAKAENERRLLALHERSQLPVVIARPGIVIGRGASPCHFGVGDWPFPSVCRVWGPGDHPMPFVLVGDVADALIRCGEVPGVEGRAFNLVGGAPLSSGEYLDALERHAGIQLERSNQPVWRGFATELFKWIVKVAVRHPGRTRPRYRAAASRTGAALFDCSSARQVLGWRPAADRGQLIAEGIHVPVDLAAR